MKDDDVGDRGTQWFIQIRDRKFWTTVIEDILNIV